MRAIETALIFSLFQAGAWCQQSEWKPLFDGKSLDGWRETPFTGKGKVSVEDGAIVLDAGGPMTGITWTRDVPRTNYEIRFEGRRIRGGDFFASLTFPVGIPIAPGLRAAGAAISWACRASMDGTPRTTKRGPYFNFDNGRWYTLRLRVTEDRITAWIDNNQIINVEIAGRTIGLRPGPTKLCIPLGFMSYNTAGAVRRIEYRPIKPRNGAR